MSEAVKREIKKPIANVFRRAKIKRRQLLTGLFETDWYDISKDVKSWGKITNEVDSARRFLFTFGNAKLTMENEEGRYNPHNSPSSVWYGYLNQQRTLVQIQAGFYSPLKNSNGIWTLNESPSPALYDEAVWDGSSAFYDETGTSTVFTGIISGDQVLSDKNEVVFNIRPLSSIFHEFPASNLTGWTTTGCTASQFVGMVRDQTDGAGSFIFRPFFGDTTSNWEISTTSTLFANLNTSGAKDVVNQTVWEVIEKLAEAENFVPYVTRDGVFRFTSRDSVATATAFEFHGAGSFNSEYGQTIKTVDSYGFKISKYYSRVQVKFIDADTSTSYVVYESTLTVSATSNPWVFGVRTLDIENFYIPNTATAATTAQTVFNDVSGLKNEIQFTTSFIPQLDLFDRMAIYYDPAQINVHNLWDQNNWADDATSSANDLIWDNSPGDAIILQGEEFKFLSYTIDLDSFENKYLAREV